MKFRSNFFTILFVLLSFSAVNSQDNQTEVKILRHESQKGFGCYFSNGVMQKDEFEKIRAEKDCGGLRALEVDFEKESLIAFETRGDCHLDATAKVFQNLKTKKYIVEVTNLYGGCRAAGNFHGLLVVKKIPADYLVEFVKKVADKAETKDVYKKWINSDVIHFGTKLEFNTVDLKNCVQSKQFVIRTQADFLKEIRPDASRDWCLENLPKINFDNYSLVGIELSTDYCNRPQGLNYEILRDKENKQVFFNISYDDPQGRLCRRIGFYDISLLVPQIPADAEVKFEIKINPPENR